MVTLPFTILPFSHFELITFLFEMNLASASMHYGVFPFRLSMGWVRVILAV
jgi:hypothetical protein